MVDSIPSEVPQLSGEDQGYPVLSQIPRKSSAVPKLAIKGAAARIRTKALSSKKASKAEEKDARKYQKALDKEVVKAEREAK